MGWCSGGLFHTITFPLIVLSSNMITTTPVAVGDRWQAVAMPQAATGRPLGRWYNRALARSFTLKAQIAWSETRIDF